MKKSTEIPTCRLIGTRVLAVVVGAVLGVPAAASAATVTVGSPLPTTAIRFQFNSAATVVNTALAETVRM